MNNAKKVTKEVTDCMAVLAIAGGNPFFADSLIASMDKISEGLGKAMESCIYLHGIKLDCGRVFVPAA